MPRKRKRVREPEILSPTQASRKTSRQSEYSPDLGDLICDRLADGRTLRDVCKDPDIPVDEKTVRRWATNPSSPFPRQYDLARQVGY